MCRLTPILILLLLIIIMGYIMYTIIEHFECTTVIELNKKIGVPEKNHTVCKNETIVLRNANNEPIKVTIGNKVNHLKYNEKWNIQFSESGKFYYHIDDKIHSRREIVVT